MKSFTLRLVCAAALFVGCASPSVRAQTCKLEEIASLDMQVSPHGLLVPVKMEGVDKWMLIDTGTPLSVVDPKAATDLNLITHRIYQGAMFDSAGQQFTSMAEIHDLRIGNLHASNVKTLVYPSAFTSDSRIAGLLGGDFLRNYDFELDFAAGKLNLFSQDHCPGQVIYWKADAVAVVPVHVVQSGHIELPVVLDGKSFDAVFDTGATHSILTQNAATTYFHLRPGSAEAPETGNAFYKHMFDKLEIEGVTISHPTVLIHEDFFKYGIQQSSHTGTMIADSSESTGQTDMILGMSELQHLHIFLSYKEQKLYITAGAAAQSAQAAPAAAMATK